MPGMFDDVFQFVVNGTFNTETDLSDVALRKLIVIERLFFMLLRILVIRWPCH